MRLILNKNAKWKRQLPHKLSGNFKKLGSSRRLLLLSLKIAFSISTLGWSLAQSPGPGGGSTQNSSPVSPATLASLQEQIKSLQEQIELLKEGPRKDPEAEGWLKTDFFKGKGLSFGFYGETKYRFPQSGANAFDPHRFVLIPSYQINDWLIFNSEIELEHGAVDESTNGGRNRFDGELELEQLYVDILIRDYFNIRSLGINLVPVGRINNHHEPTTFYSTERPELYQEIIPSTWFEPGFGFFGKLSDSWNYEIMISTGLEEMIPGVGAPGITAASGMRNARPRLRAASENSLAYSGKISYKGLPGLDTSTSFYVTRVLGFGDQHSTLSLANIEALYRVPKTGLEFRSDFAIWNISAPEVLLANNNANTLDDVGNRMYGWYVEAAYHYWPEAWKEGRGQGMDFVPFFRYSDIVLQSDLPPTSILQDNGTVNKSFITTGVSYFLNENFVIKADYRHNLNGSSTSELNTSAQDYFQLGAGLFF